MSILSQHRWKRLCKLIGLLQENHPNVLNHCGCYVVDDAMLARAREWIDKHNEEKHKGKTPYAGAIGGAHGWLFIDTGLGTVTSIRCMCGAEGDVTNMKAFG